MRSEILNLLHCPNCRADLDVTPYKVTKLEIRSGTLSCKGPNRHTFDIDDGILRFAVGFDHEAVQRELDYENSTYHGSERLKDAKLIAQFPDTLAELWPHTRHFGPDFRMLIDELRLKPGSWVLDVGTGPCWSSRLLAQRGFNVIALDVNDAEFYGLRTSDILFQHYDIYFERILESMTHLPLRNASVDAITFNASFHHTPDMQQTLSECFRVLKPGGVVAMVNEEFASIRQRIFPAGQNTDGGSHHTIHYDEFEQGLRRTGFQHRYFVAHHVRTSLKKVLSPNVGRAVVRALEKFPISLKQLNSALIILRKPEVHRRPAPAPSLAMQT
jgi:SAM-dependent methyltransferase